MIDGGIKLSVVIPSYSAERLNNVVSIIKKLAQDLCSPSEIIIVRKVSPAGKARNIGAKHTCGDVIVFIDDDAMIASENVLCKLLRPLVEDNTIGLTGAVQKSAPNPNWIQKIYAKQFPRTESPDIKDLTDSDMATTLFCAVRRDVFERIGGFDEMLVAGEDNLFRYMVRKLGKRVVLVPDTLVYHPLPDSLVGVFRREIWYAYGMAQITQHNLMEIGVRRIKNWLDGLIYALTRVIIFPARLFYGGPDGKSFGFWFLRAPAWLVNTIAYVWFSLRLMYGKKDENIN